MTASFSERHGFRAMADEPIYEGAPQAAHQGLEADAEFVLATSAASIIYLSKI